MFQETLKQYVLDNPKSVSMKSAGSDIFVLKYKKSVFYNNSWDDFLEHCRGTIVDNDFNIVSYPFQKIYNYQIEDRAPQLANDTEITAFRKVNGFMIAATWYKGDLLISTTGSTDNDYVTMAKEMMATHQKYEDWQLAFCKTDMDGLTVMFECAHPNDPHIIPEKPGMYVLGYRENQWNSKVGYDPKVLEILASEFNCFLPESYQTTVGGLNQQVKSVRHEGFVAYTKDGVAFKIKSPYYLMKKWVARNPRTDKLMNETFKKQIAEEYYPLLDNIRANIEEYTKLDEQARLVWVRNFLERG